MNRYKNNNRYYGGKNYNNYDNYDNYNYNNNYNYYNYYYDYPYPEVARLPYGILDIISRETGCYINPAVYNPKEKKRHYKINCHASFNCSACNKEWTSNRITVELWWKNGKKEFDVRMYGQQCKKCNGEFMIPYISSFQNIIIICVEVLTTNSKGKGANINKNTNTEFNSSHDEKRCQKCKMVGHPCWK